MLDKIFSLGNAISTAWTFGSALFGGGRSGSPADMFADEDANLYDSSTALGFIKKGAQAWVGAQDKDAQVFSQAPKLERARTIKELTRGTAVGQVQMPEMQQRLYQNPEVSRYWEALYNSQNPHLQNLRAAAGQEVTPTVRSGRKTKVIAEATLKGEVGI
jgi:hypothetical protein